MLRTPGTDKSRKLVRFDWTVGLQQEIADNRENYSQPIIEEVVPAPTKEVDIRGLPLCKYCQQPIQWGEVTEAVGEDTRTGYWIPLNPDFSRHGCRN